MDFDYSLYYDYCFYDSVESLIAILIGTIYVYLGLTKKIPFEIKGFFGPVGNKRFLIGFMIVFGIWNTIFCCSHLMSGGIYLYSEKEADAIVIQGYISEKQELNNFQLDQRVNKQYHEFGTSTGYKFVVNNIQCKAPLKANEYEIGAYVAIRYLPKSKYILSIEELEDE